MGMVLLTFNRKPTKCAIVEAVIFAFFISAANLILSPALFLNSLVSPRPILCLPLSFVYQLQKLSNSLCFPSPFPSYPFEYRIHHFLLDFPFLVICSSPPTLHLLHPPQQPPKDTSQYILNHTFSMGKM